MLGEGLGGSGDGGGVGSLLEEDSLLQNKMEKARTQGFCVLRLQPNKCNFKLESAKTKEKEGRRNNLSCFRLQSHDGCHQHSTLCAIGAVYTLSLWAFFCLCAHRV